MVRWILMGLGGLIAALIVGFWYLLLGGASAPAKADGVYDIDQWRRLVGSPAPETLPTDIGFLEIGHDAFPAFVVQAGAFGRDAAMSFNALQIRSPDRNIVVGGAVDAETAAAMASGEAANFSAEAYQTLLEALSNADDIFITHEHLDHVMAIARHPDLPGLLAQLRLNADQLETLKGFMPDGVPSGYDDLTAQPFDGPYKAAPGVVIVPSAGHTPGTQAIFVTLQTGQEYLLVGDIVWAMSNLDDLKTRPRLTQFVVFDPNEDRSAVRKQVRALHDLRKAEPGLIIVPSHDRDYLKGLLAGGQLSEGFN